MRLAIVRQDYRPEGAVERGLERVLEALLERNVAVSLYTRSWPQTRLQLIEPSIIDPFHLGSAVARLRFRARGLSRRAPLATESRRIARAAAVLRRLPRHRRRARGVARGAAATRGARPDGSPSALSPHNRYLLDVERRLFASPWLRAVICGSNMVRDEIRGRFAVPRGQAPRHLRFRGHRHLPSGAPGGARRASSSGMASTPRPPSISRWPPISRAPTSARPSTRLRSSLRRRTSSRSATIRTPRAIGRARKRGGVANRVTLVGNAGRPAAVLRRGRRLRAPLALRSVPGRSARSAGLRCPRYREREDRRRGAGARARLRAHLPVRRRRGARRPHAGAAGPANARGVRGQRARRRAAALAGGDHAAAGSPVPGPARTAPRTRRAQRRQPQALGAHDERRRAAQGANCAPLGGSAAATAASVGAHQ